MMNSNRGTDTVQSTEHRADPSRSENVAVDPTRDDRLTRVSSKSPRR